MGTNPAFAKKLAPEPHSIFALMRHAYLYAFITGKKLDMLIFSEPFFHEKRENSSYLLPF